MKHFKMNKIIKAVGTYLFVIRGNLKGKPKIEHICLFYGYRRKNIETLLHVIEVGSGINYVRVKESRQRKVCPKGGKMKERCNKNHKMTRKHCFKYNTNKPMEGHKNIVVG